MNVNENILDRIERLGKETPKGRDAIVYLGVESFGTFIYGITDKFKEKITGLMATVNYNQTLVNKIRKNESNFYYKELLALEEDVRAIRDNANYDIIKLVKVQIPPGLKIRMNKAVDIILPAITLEVQNTLVILNDIDTLISKMIQDVQYLASTTPIKHDLSAQKVTNALEKYANEILTTKAVADVDTYEKVYGNINHLIYSYNKVTKDDFPIGADHLSKLFSVTNSIGEKVNILIETLENEEDIKMSKVVAQELGATLDDTARLVTASVATIELYNEILDSIGYAIRRVRSAMAAQ